VTVSDPPTTESDSRVNFADVLLVVIAGVGAGVLVVNVVFLILEIVIGPVEEMSNIVVGSAASASIYLAMLPAVYLLVVRRKGVTWSSIGLRSPKSHAVGYTILAWVFTFAGTLLVAIILTNLFGEEPPNVSEQLGVNDDPLTVAEIAWLSIVSVCIAPVTEEIVFRGLLFDAFRSRWSFAVAAAATAFLFAASHQALLTIPGLMVLGLGLAWLRERLDSLYPAMWLHVLNNALAITILVLTTNAAA
jgi:uncharacterized protein